MSIAGSLGHSDIDSLTLAVRDQVSRRLITEAITAYRGGALRSALMSTWIAVVYDIIAKARELASQSEAVPRAFVMELDAAIADENTRKLQKIEFGLLKRANSDFQLLAPHECAALIRIQEDRHLCAHPAFVSEDELYQPSPELVRAHIAHALQHLLVHAPLQGKSAIARFAADLLSPAFPTTADEIRAFVREKYLDRAKDVLVVNLIKAIISAPFGTERTKYIGKARTLAVTLREVANAKTAIYEYEVPGYVARKFGHIPDEVLLTICPFLESDPRIWVWLTEPDRARVRKLLETASVEDITTNSAFHAFVVPALANVLLERFEAFDATTKISIIAEHPCRELIPAGIKIYGHAGSYRSSEQAGRSVILSLAPYFNADELKAVLEAASNNGQIWDASGTPKILEQLFDQTISLLPDSRPHWNAFLDDLVPQQMQWYSGLQERLNQNP